MFFFHRKNRRNRAEQVLEVKAYSMKVRAARWRMATLALGISLAVLLSGLLLWRLTEWGLRCLVYENEAFALRHYDVQTDGVLSPDQIRQWSGVKLGDNLLSIDLEQVRRNLELMPLIKSAAVERILPQTFQVRIAERNPMVQALALTPRGQGEFDFEMFYLDDEGFVMLPSATVARPSAANANNEMLTRLSGLSIADLRPGRRVELPQVLSALRLVELFEESALFGAVDLARIDVSQPDLLVVTTGQGSETTLATNQMELQLGRWRLVWDDGQKKGKSIATLDLSITNNIPVTYVEADAVPQVPPKMIKTSRSRKKHV